MVASYVRPLSKVWTRLRSTYSIGRQISSVWGKELNKILVWAMSVLDYIFSWNFIGLHQLACPILNIRWKPLIKLNSGKHFTGKLKADWGSSSSTSAGIMVTCYPVVTQILMFYMCLLLFQQKIRIMLIFHGFFFADFNGDGVLTFDDFYLMAEV